MMIRTLVIAAAGAASLLIPVIAPAQTVPEARAYAALEGFNGYPELRSDTDRIRDQIRLGVRDGSLTLDQARDFRSELARIQDDEAVRFRDFGWSLPAPERQDLRASLDDLSDAIDEARAPA